MQLNDLLIWRGVKMRALIRSAIIADSELIGLGVVPEGVLAGNVDTPQPRPFLNLKWGIRNPGVSVVTRTTLVIWVHDQPNDYTRIEQICVRLRNLLTSLEAAQDTVVGGWVNVVDWVSDSDDLFDEGHGTITKQCTFIITGSN
jgi:hypothetical protein